MRRRGAFLAIFVASVPVVVGTLPVVLVFESADILYALASGPAADLLEFLPCAAPDYCSTLGGELRQRTLAVVGQPKDIGILTTLPHTQLLQSLALTPPLARVPPSILVAHYVIDYQKEYGAEPIAEYVIASVFEWNYRLRQHTAEFTSCAWGEDAPLRCPPASSLTSHPVLFGQTIGILGYGVLGEAVARRSAALGMRTVATKRKGPFQPPPPPLTWLSDDNDLLLRESDFVVVAVPGSTLGMINETALALMKPDAVLLPLSAGPIDFAALYDALSKRTVGGAVLDTWPNGCWKFPVNDCGPPYGPPAEPYPYADIQKLDNVIALPGMAMRDSRYWANNIAFVELNLLALASGRPLQGVVGNGTMPVGGHAFAEEVTLL